MKRSNPQFLSPEKYIRTRARNLAIGTCYINENWKEAGEAFIVVTRRHTNGNLTIGFYLVDIFALGVKDTGYKFNQSPAEVNEFFQRFTLQHEEANYLLVHNIIYGAIEFAEEYGHTPHKDFHVTRFILEEDDERVPLVDIEFGRDGEPFYIMT